MPWSELAIRTAFGVAAVSVSAVVYVKTLLFLGHRIGEPWKTGVALAVFIAFAAVIGASFIGILESEDEIDARQSVVYLVVVLVSWMLVVAPGYFYIFRFRLLRFRAAGYFLRRGSRSAT